MPELAEVEVARQNLARWWQDKAATEVHILDARLLVATDPEALVETLQHPLTTMRRRGKYLIAEFTNDHAIVFHFRMTGKIVLSPIESARFARLAWHIPETGWLIFKDQRRFAHLQLFAPNTLKDYAPLAKMGPEPHDLTPEILGQRLAKPRLLKAALLDQATVAGIGNIAISEVFWRTKIAPDANTSDLTDAQIEALATDLPAYFDEVIEKSMADEIIYLEERSAENIFEVYARENDPCPRCTTPIVRTRIAARSTFYCPHCQAI
ncbi:MAG: hypothetical protein H0U74_19235 [Bradymonadaceae bacterium]|nr:hypothetical protein [Lujinxingiaceae bacterium]